MNAIAEKPELTFGLLQPDRRSTAMAVSNQRVLFRSENYNLFKKLGRDICDIQDIPAEIRQSVDAEVYDRVGEWFDIPDRPRNERRKFWYASMNLANHVFDEHVRELLFVSEERQATLTADVKVDKRPSSILGRLTMPIDKITKQGRYEQGRQLALGWSAAEVLSEIAHMSKDPDDVLTDLHNLFARRAFVGKIGGNNDNAQFYSYHEPETNRLVGISEHYPDQRFDERFWVKAHKEPVRTIELKTETGGTVHVNVLYDPDQKDLGSLVVKGWHRSLKAAQKAAEEVSREAGEEAAKSQIHKGKIETAPYRGDAIRLRMVPVVFDRQQGDWLRDEISKSSKESIEQWLPGFKDIKPDDEVNKENGDPSRFLARRWKISIDGLSYPIELVIQSLWDYLVQEYEVGRFDSKLGMHNGYAHRLYKLKLIGEMARSFWPPPIFDLDLKEAQANSSSYNAFILRNEKRIHPLRDPDFVAQLS